MCSTSNQRYNVFCRTLTGTNHFSLIQGEDLGATVILCVYFTVKQRTVIVRSDQRDAKRM